MNRRPLSRFGVLLLALLVAGACGKPPSKGVGMSRFAADLVFGVPPVSEPISDAAQSTQAPTTIEFELIEPLSSSQTPFSQPLPTEACPEAGPTDFPEKEAPRSIEGFPKAGDYRWKQLGQEKQPTFPFPLPLAQFASRSVKDINGSQGNFSFKTVEKDPSTSSKTLITRTFQVGSSGLALRRIEWDPRDGTAPKVFEPLTGIPYLPVPFQVNTSFDNTGVDPVHLQTLQHKGTIKERRRVDACGDVVDGWYVDGEQILAGSSSGRVDFNYLVATQFGGLLVFEKLQRPCNSTGPDGNCQPAPDLTLETNIGQIEPNPK